jgi:hypothetical protein
VTPEEIYNAWAPPQSPWSQWAKPVVFAHMATPPNPYVLPPDQVSDPVSASFDITHIPPADGKTAVVIDMPSATGATLALRLANERGYRPVPLYNAVPAPFHADTLAMYTKAGVAIDMHDILESLRAWADELAALHLPPEAPPAFILDARRRGAGWSPTPGHFDNRSVSLPTDFPSATFLQSRGVRNALLIQPVGLGQAQPDLAHTLRRWQDGTVDLSLYEIDAPQRFVRPLDVPKPSWFGHVWHNVLVLAGLRRNAMGGFGGFLPVPSSSHGGIG